MSKRNYWLLFGAIQAAGLIAPYFANVHMFPLPLFVSLILLLPGVLIGLLSHLPDSMTFAVAVAVNAVAWYWLRKILRLDHQ